MKGFRNSRSKGWRAGFASLIAGLFTLNLLIAAFAATPVAGSATTLADALQLGPVCLHVDADGAPLAKDEAPKPAPPAFCPFCVLAHAIRIDRGDELTAFVNRQRPQTGALVATLIDNHSGGPHPQSGRASSWSARAPPVFA